MRLKFNTGLRKLSFSDPKLYQELILILYKLSLDMLYLFTVTPFYKYTGMALHFSIIKYIISTIVLLLMVRPVINLYNKGTLSSMVILLLNLLYFIPGCALYAFAGLSDLYFLFFTLYWMILMILEKYITIPEFSKLNYSSNKLIFYPTLIVITIGILFITGLYNRFNLHFALTDVYDLRYSQRKLNLPTIVNYFQPITATLIPIALVYCLIEKKHIWSFILILLQLLSFAFGGMKMTLFLLLAALLIYFFYENRKNHILTFAFISLNILALGEVLIRNFSYVTGYVLNRTFFIPNLLSFQYFDYFSHHQLLYWRDSFLNRFGFSSPYPHQVPNLMAREYYADPNGFANNGICGDAYSNFGWISLIIFPFLIICFCKFIDACAKNADSRILLIAAAVFAMGFTNSSFFVLLLSNGFLFAIILMYILPYRTKVLSENINL